MDFEIWTDKNGTQWKVSEMTTRQINKTLGWINETLANKMFNKIKPTDNVEMNVNMINYLIEWGGRFEMELKRGKEMTKERLEELIKQRATIWIGDFGEYKLDEKHCEICKINDLRGNFLGRYCFWYEYDYNGEKCHSECELEDIEENVERGKWHWEMDACRTERFEPPMWEEIENEYKFKFVANGFVYVFLVNKHYNAIILETTVSDPIIHEFDELATKENYEKACEIVRDLFKGEK